MTVYRGIIFLIWMEFKFGMTATCGTLEFEQATVTEGGTARLVYKPINIQASILWLKENPGASPTTIYDSHRSSSTAKYTEITEGSQITLLINNVERTDAGSFVVDCGGGVYTARAKLNVTIFISGDVQSSCGNLQLENNNLTEGPNAKLIFTIQPGREISWERQTNSYFMHIYESTKYDISKNNDKTLHILLIFQTDYADSGTYRVNCSHSVSNTVQLSVVPKAPSSPVFLGVEDIHDCTKCIPASLNELVQVKCSVDGGTQPVDMNIFKDENVVNDVQRSQDDSKFDLKSFVMYNFTTTAENFDTTFTCKVKNPALPVELAQSAKLYIKDNIFGKVERSRCKVKPKTINLEVKPAMENETSEILCTTTQGRPPMKSSIFLSGVKQDNVEITGETRIGFTYSVTTRLVKVLTRFENRKTVFCCSQKSICSNKTNVNVKFSPQSVSVIEVKKDNKENGDTELTLKCSVSESNPRSSIDWKGLKNVPRNLTHNEYRTHNKTQGWTFSTTWVLSLTKADNYRNIKCQVSNSEFPDLQLFHSYRPNITYSPIITIDDNENKIVYTGEDVFLKCNVDSNPPSVIEWYNETDKVEGSYGANNSDLHLTNISIDHSKTYTCKARNGIGGTKTGNITLLVKEKSYNQHNTESKSASIVGPILGGTFAVIVAIVAVVIVITLRKWRQNAVPQRKRSYQIKVEERNLSVHPARNEPNNMLAAGHANEVEDQPEYAIVVPKAKRKQVSEPLNHEDERLNTEKGDTLVYAELDLHNPSEYTPRRPFTADLEPTEYVSIDFTKTGTVKIEDDEEKH